MNRHSSCLVWVYHGFSVSSSLQSLIFPWRQMASLHWSFVNRSCAPLTSFNLAHAQKTSEGDLWLENKLVPILNLGLSFGSPSNNLALYKLHADMRFLTFLQYNLTFWKHGKQGTKLFVNPLITVPAKTGFDFAQNRVWFLTPLEGIFLSPIVLIVFRKTGQSESKNYKSLYKPM